MEAEAVNRWLTIGELAGYPVNIVHLSTWQGLEQVRIARKRLQEVYVETCPQYLTLTGDKYRLPGFEGAKYVCAPPLRAQINVDALWEALAAGEIDFVVGTHALITGGVEYRRLGLVVTDEQHRFGVGQRAALIAKGRHPHTLVMSATPIPRTLALIIYGDLDVSVIDQLPPGRTPIATYVVREDKRQRMYGFVRKQVEEGRQAYIICPAVEEGEDSDLKAVTAFAKELAEVVFPELRVAFVHGKLKSRDKEAEDSKADQEEDRRKGCLYKGIEKQKPWDFRDVHKLRHFPGVTLQLKCCFLTLSS